jgi:hypothetical protein
VDLHHLLLAGLPAHPCENRTPRQKTKYQAWRRVVSQIIVSEPAVKRIKYCVRAEVGRVFTRAGPICVIRRPPRVRLRWVGATATEKISRQRDAW